jgi:flagella basal body P-ring formation protein FlgA
VWCRRRMLSIGALAVAGLAGAGPACVQARPDSWTLALADSVVLPAGPVVLGDIARGPLAAVPGRLLIWDGGPPGASATIERALVLRKLRQAGLADGVRLAGAEACRVRLEGSPLPGQELRQQLRDRLNRWLPPADPQGPEPWLEVDLRVPQAAVNGTWRLELVQPRTLEAGRNIATLQIKDSVQTMRTTAVVICHAYGEVACALAPIPKGQDVTADLFRWEWRDLAAGESGLAVGRACLQQMVTTRNLPAGQILRQADLRPRPFVRQGEPVELCLRRGAVVVTVRACARQDGGLGQVVSVRNEVSGQLVAARVTGPGQVEWRR